MRLWHNIKRLLNIVFTFIIIWFLVETLILFSPVFAVDRNWLGYCVLFVLSITGVLYYHQKVCLNYAEKRFHVSLLNKKAEAQKEMIRDFLNKELHYLNYWELVGLLDKVKHLKLHKDVKTSYGREFEAKLKESEKVLKLKIKENEISELNDRKIDLQREIEELEKEKHRKLISDANKSEYIKGRLKIEENYVFRKDKLNKNQVNVLLENGFDHFNEYDIIEKKLLPVLIKTDVGHSPAHLFVVWSVKRYLKTIEWVSKIEEHFTRDADLTFNYGGKKFAFEIETGTLLGKKEQLTEKVKYLNRKYRKRWAFVPTNRNLVGKYNEFGTSIQRSQMSNFLEKWLKIHTQ